MAAFDYVIVGAGTAGCVLANRLSADSATRVLVLEAGGANNHPLMSVPLMAGLIYFVRSTNWSYTAAPEPHLNDRRIAWPRGKVLGGTSSINGMMYMRGHRRDYDDWAAMGLTGWSYAEVLPYFKRAEGHADRRDRFHGADGPFKVSRAASDNPLYAAFVAAGQAAGYPFNDDFNGAEQEGVGRQDFAIHQGRRVSAATAYLAPARSRPNLEVRTRAMATKILFDGGRTTGVAYHRGEREETVQARREVLLCGGAINAPALLQLSGVGDADHLNSLGIPVVLDRKAVGENLHDHLGCYVQYECTEPITLYSLFRPDRALSAVLRAKLFGSGPGASVPLEGGGFVRTRAEYDIPDIQITFIPGLNLDTTRKAQGRHGFLTHFYQLRPESRGHVRIVSADPLRAPEIRANAMAAETDRTVMREGLRVVRNIVAQAPFDAYRGPEIAPGAAIQADDALDAWLHDNATTVWHPVGTCRMGADPDAVVDDELKVRGLEGLRVIDASVMPAIPGANTAAPTIMIAEKAADMVLGKAPLPAEAI